MTPNVDEGRLLGARDDLANVSPYVSPQMPGWTGVRMNTNESPYPPPPTLVTEIAEEIRSLALNRYPDRDASALLEALSAHTQWPTDGLWVANGSNEVFLHLFLVFGGPGRRALTFTPTYSMHSLIPQITGTTVESVPRGLDFRIDIDAARDAIRRTNADVVIVCSPNNPTGGTESLETVRALLDEAPGLVVVDEAYIEFADPAESVRALLADHPNLIITKTFSKAWRLAGVRIGYMLCNPRLVGELQKVRLPYHLSAITQVVARAALRHVDETMRLARAVAGERDRLAEGLDGLGIKTHPSRANFVLFEVGDASAVWRSLLDRGILIRNYDDDPGLRGCLRVTAGLPEETEVFLDAIKDVVGE